MKIYASPKAFEHALTEQLRKRQTPTRTINDLRREVAFDRILARLRLVSPNTWLLKGGVALDYRFKDDARTTVDIDLTSHSGIETMTQAVHDAAKIATDDYFQLRVGDRHQPIDDVDTYRFNISVLFGDGRMFLQNLKLDVGFGDPWIGEPETLTSAPLLAFAGIPPTTVPAIPMEQHLSEKLHAYTRDYDGRSSSRVKDLVDMALMLRHREFDPNRLLDTLITVFSSRATHELPQRMPAPPVSWVVPYAKLARDHPVPQDLDNAFRFVSDKIDPVLSKTEASDPR